MANIQKYVREKANIKPTRNGKGLEQTIKIRVYDNGFININGNAFGKGREWSAAHIWVMQLMVELENQVQARNSEVQQ